VSPTGDQISSKRRKVPLREPIGAEHAYTHAPGIVLRCRHCEDVLLVVTQPPGRTLLAFSRSSWVEVTAEG
jgi:Family of unknown function (DUF6510)